MMRRRTTVGIALLAGLALAGLPLRGTTGPARAAEPVDLALVLAADVSRSIDEQEFQLQRKGYATALMNPQVLRAIQSGPLRAVAVLYVEWSSEYEQRTIVDWTVIKDGETAAEVAQTILSAPRPFASRTSISAAIDFGTRALERSNLEATRRIIDVSGDGTNNSGRPVTDARDTAVAAGITVNALAILNENPQNVFAMDHVRPPGGLPDYFRNNVIGGPGSFLLQVVGFASFAEAITQKLVSEIAALPSPSRHAAK